MVQVTFHPDNKSSRVPRGTTILAAARVAGVVIEAPCNGAGHCGKCAVRVSPADLANIFHHPGQGLTPEELARGTVLSCHAEIRGDLAVQLLPREEQGLKIVTGGIERQVPLDPFVAKKFNASTGQTGVYAGAELLHTEPGDTSREIYGVVVDIGTTTLVASIVDLVNGREVVSLSALNPQSVHAQDVLSRIRFSADGNGLEVMYAAIAGEVDRLIQEGARQAGVNPAAIYEVVYSGNTCMLHLATGTDPASLGSYPFIPVIRGGSHLSAAAHRLGIAGQGLIYLPPVISAYVGADISAGIMAAELATLSGTTLFIDIGTNGEMALAVDGSIAASSTAAGPAFEGMNISCGMRAAVGAVELFRVEDDGGITIRTIGETEPVGICGSGLLDLVGELVEHGVIGATGRFVDPATAGIPEQLRARLVREGGKTLFRVGEKVALTQKDIRQVQLAKGAIRAGIQFLLQQKGVAAADVDRVLIAGSFGYHLREESLLTLGLLPPAFAGKVAFLGNTSMSGGEMLLLNRGIRNELERLVTEIAVVELTACENFDRVFMDAMGF